LTFLERILEVDERPDAVGLALGGGDLAGL